MKRISMTSIAWLGVIGSVICNGWFSYGRGVIPWGEYLADGLVFVLVFCALDLIKPVLPGLIGRAQRTGEYVKAGAASILFVCAIAYSALAAYGFLQTNLSTRVAANKGAQVSYTNAQATAAEQRDVVRAAKTSRRWKSTSGCTNDTAKQSIKFCREYRMAMHRLERAQLLMDAAPAPVALDAQSEGLSKVTGLDAGFIGATISIALALIIELFAAFGPFIMAERPKDDDHGEDPSQDRAPLPANVTDMEAYMMDKISRGRGNAMVSNEELVAKFGVSSATATRAKQRLKREGLVTIEKDGRRHRLVAV